PEGASYINRGFYLSPPPHPGAGGLTTGYHQHAPTGACSPSPPPSPSCPDRAWDINRGLNPQCPRPPTLVSPAPRRGGDIKHLLHVGATLDNVLRVQDV